MTTLAASYLTMADIAKETLPDGSIEADVVNLLAQDNPILDDMTWEEANGGTSHRSVQTISIPEPQWVRFYEGVTPSKSGRAQVDEPIGRMKNRSQVDKDLLDMSPNPNLTRLNQAKDILEGFNQSFVSTLLTGASSTAPAKFNGIMPRFESLTGITGENIIDAGGTGSDNASILLVNWGRRVFGIYPRGSKVGISRTDMGVQQITDSDNGGRYSVYEEEFAWNCGLVVADWRNVVRAVNIDKSLLVAQTGAAAILELMAGMVDKLPSEGGRPAFYMNRTLSTMLRIQCMKQANVYLTVGNEEGRRKIMFDTIPIRKVDQMQADETRVT
jgi:hypothetical protein